MIEAHSRATTRATRWAAAVFSTVAAYAGASCAAAAVAGAPPAPAGAAAPDSGMGVGETTLPASCENAVAQPDYASPDAAPNVRFFKESPLPVLPVTPSCLGIDIQPFGTYVAVAGTFKTEARKIDLLRRFGAVSKTLQVTYWSVSEHRWRPLLKSAAATTEAGRPREDFTGEELESGRELYVSQTDGRSSGATVFRMRLRENAARRFVIDFENVSPVRWWTLTLYRPGELHSVYVVVQRSPEVWGYYSLTTVGSNWLEGHESSYINRVVALYRHYTESPADPLQPPAS